MTVKQKIILICFNFIALFSIMRSGWLLRKEMQDLLFASKGFDGISRQVLRRFTFIVEIQSEMVVVYNYLYMFSLLALIINIILIITFTMWNKRRN